MLNCSIFKKKLLTFDASKKKFGRSLPKIDKQYFYAKAVKFTRLPFRNQESAENDQ